MQPAGPNYLLSVTRAAPLNEEDDQDPDGGELVLAEEAHRPAGLLR